jgi:hypothetical protein
VAKISVEAPLKTAAFGAKTMPDDVETAGAAAATMAQ